MTQLPPDEFRLGMLRVMEYTRLGPNTCRSRSLTFSSGSGDAIFPEGVVFVRGFVLAMTDDTPSLDLPADPSLAMLPIGAPGGAGPTCNPAGNPFEALLAPPALEPAPL